MTDDRDYTFTLGGTIDARGEEEALARLMQALRDFGFADVGDGTLWHAASSVSITGVGIERAIHGRDPSVNVGDPSVDADFR